MKSLYNQVNNEVCKLITNRYSTSFSLGIKLFDEKFQSPICAIYAFARLADEIVDTFDDSPQKEMLETLQQAKAQSTPSQ